MLLKMDAVHIKNEMQRCGYFHISAGNTFETSLQFPVDLLDKVRV